MNTLQLYRCKELFEKHLALSNEQLSTDSEGFYIDNDVLIYWNAFSDGFEIALNDKPPILSQQQIIELANRATVDLGRESPNPYERNSAEYRYWQDGCRMGIDAIEEREENAD